MANKNNFLNEAKINKKDEFYTLYETIEEELNKYKNKLKNKVVYCNCDDYKVSNFYKYFKDNFNAFKLKSLFTSGFSLEDRNPKLAFFDGKEEIISDLETGSFYSDECLDILNKSDVIVTNPPFSIMNKFLDVIIDNNKDFILLSNFNIISNPKVFNLIRDKKLFYGHSIKHGDVRFKVPNDFIINKDTKGLTIENGEKFQRVPTVRWFTTIYHGIDKPFIELNYKYDKERYHRYENYKAINIDKVKEIPNDYFGVMGVPITFLYKWNPNQFDLIGFTGSSCTGIDDLRVDGKSKGRGIINGKTKYQRLLVRLRRK